MACIGCSWLYFSSVRRRTVWYFEEKHVKRTRLSTWQNSGFSRHMSKVAAPCIPYSAQLAFVANPYSLPEVFQSLLLCPHFTSFFLSKFLNKVTNAKILLKNLRCQEATHWQVVPALLPATRIRWHQLLRNLKFNLWNRRDGALVFLELQSILRNLFASF